MGKLGLSLLISCLFVAIMVWCGPGVILVAALMLGMLAMFPALSPGLAMIASFAICVLVTFVVLQVMLRMPRDKRPGELMG